MFFTAWTARSAPPFDCGYLGLFGRTSNPHSLGKMSALSKGGALSDRNFSGIPCLANIALRALMTSVAVLFFLNAKT